MKTLYRQFIAATLCIAVVSLILGFLATNQYYRLVTKERSDGQNVAIAQEIVDTLEHMHQREAGFDAYLQSVARLGYQLYVIGEDGSSHSYGTAFDGLSLPEEAQRVITERTVYHGIQDYAFSNFMFGHFANSLSNTVGVPFTYNDQTYGLFMRPDIKWISADIHMVFAGFVLSIFVVHLLGMIWLARQLTRPIAQLTEATRQIARENYSYPLDIRRDDEIGQLSDSFDLMQRQLQHNDQARRAFVSNVSHDLQSPLQNIQGYAGLLQSAELTESQRLEYAAVIGEESKRLSNLTAQLLLLTSLDQVAYPIRPKRYRLDEQLKTIVRNYRWLMEERDIELSYKLAPLSIRADEELLESVWDNLLTNAIKYNRHGGSIELELTSREGRAIVSCRDTGIGIGEAALPRIFERFFREDEARKSSGSGLGLAIAQEIVALHRGEIEVRSTPGEGSEFTVTLPLPDTPLGGSNA